MKRFLKAMLILLVPASIPARSEAASYLTVTNIGTGAGGTIRVMISYYPNFHGLCGSGSCVNFYDNLNVTPCPPGLPCVGGSYSKGRVNSGIFSSDSLDLTPGIAYTMSGSWTQNSLTTCFLCGPCTVTVCSIGEYYPNVLFDTPTAAVSSTWGRVKLHYR